MVNGPKQVYVERSGKLELTDVEFDDDEHVMRVIDRIVSPLGRRIDEIIADGRRPPAGRLPRQRHHSADRARRARRVTIRKFSKDPFTVEDLIRFGTFTAEMATFLKACVEARLNIVVSGGTGSGKTTMLNVLSSFIPDDERIITIENAAELQLRQDHVVRLESRPPNIEGKGEVTIRDLVINSLRMRPERIVVGECRGGEALDMLQAMNTGHDGSMTTAHANTPARHACPVSRRCADGRHGPAGAGHPRADRLRRRPDRPAGAPEGRHAQDHERHRGQGMEGDVIVLQDIFMFEQTGVENGKIVGRMKPTGIRPKFIQRFEVAQHLPAAEHLRRWHSVLDTQLLAPKHSGASARVDEDRSRLTCQ